MAEDANLSAERRLHPDHVVPSSLPVWGSIVDDIWAIEHAETQLDAGVGAAWMDAAEKAWVSRGVEPNLKKSVDSALGEEIQGYYVHPYGHWVGVSLEKRRWLFQATIHILRQRTVLVGVIERVVGKHGFVHSARPALRSVFEVTYSWLATLHRRRHGHVALPREVWIELAVSAMLLPYASLNLSSEWSNRVECTDASMSGIGRAWGVVPQHVAQTLARYADHATVYTNLKLPWGIGLNKEHKCPLRRIRVPIERIKWHKVGCPWRASHITLGEADAIVWAAEDRLRRPSDFNCRFVHPVDSAACAGCFSKGRSSSRALNQRCRRACAICVCGNHSVFYPWIPSEENPADDPSRLWEETDGFRAQVEGARQPPPLSETDLSRVGPWPRDVRYFIHLCSGPRTSGDLCSAVEQVGALHGFNIVGVRVDPLAIDPFLQVVFGDTHCGDLLNGQHGLALLDLIHTGSVIGGYASPPCTSILHGRHRPKEAGKRKPGSLPLRSREHVWEAWDRCSDAERRTVTIESTLHLLCLGLLGEIRIEGGMIGMGQPARSGHQYLFYLNTQEVDSFKQRFELVCQEVHLCMYGGTRRSAKSLLLPRHGGRVAMKCDRGHSHVHHKMIAAQTSAAKYPEGFCYALADCFIQRASAVRDKGYLRPYRPQIPSEAAGKDPWHHIHDVRWPWPEPHPNFLAQNLEAIHSGKILCGLYRT